MKNKLNKEHFANMSKDAGNWKGIIYFNRKDSRIIVPKLNPQMGWTLNFANPYTYLSLATIILILISTKYFT